MRPQFLPCVIFLGNGYPLQDEKGNALTPIVTGYSLNEFGCSFRTEGGGQWTFIKEEAPLLSDAQLLNAWLLTNLGVKVVSEKA